MDAGDLRVVQEIELNELWDHEEHDFTPWLVSHIDQLGRVIGIEIEDVERENSVGEFSADIVGTDMNTDSKVVIENQFGETNHGHLGQLLTYAAGTDAEFVIWVAEGYRDEHRSVLEWLNTGGAGAAKFFGVRPRVIKLDGADEIGFEFTVVVEPNDWERELQDSLTDRERAYKEFFTELTDEYAATHPTWNKIAAQPQSWLAFGVGIGGVRFSWSFHQGPEFSTELYIDSGDEEQNLEIYQILEEDREEIEAEIGQLVWQQLPEKRACRIKSAKSIDTTIEGLSSMQQRELIEWGAERMDDLRDVFEPRLQSV